MAATAVEDPGLLQIMQSKDWSTQTELRRQESTDVMTQYENQRQFYDDFMFAGIRVSHSSSQTDILQAQSTLNSSTQKDDVIKIDNSTQKVPTRAVSSTHQSVIELKESSSQHDQTVASVSTQSLPEVAHAVVQTGATVAVHVAIQSERNIFDMETQKSFDGVDSASQAHIPGDDHGAQTDIVGDIKETTAKGIAAIANVSEKGTSSASLLGRTDYGTITERNNYDDKEIQTNTSGMHRQTQVELIATNELSQSDFSLLCPHELSNQSFDQSDPRREQSTEADYNLKQEDTEYDYRKCHDKTLVSTSTQYDITPVEGKKLEVNNGMETRHIYDNFSSQLQSMKLLSKNQEKTKIAFPDGLRSSCNRESMIIDTNGNQSDVDSHAFGDAMIAKVHHHGSKTRKSVGASNGGLRRYCIIA